MNLHGEKWQLKKKKVLEKERLQQKSPFIPKPASSEPFRILITTEAQAGYDKLAANIKQAMNEIMERLKAWPEVSGFRPYFGEGWAPGKFRMKTWDWRIEFLVNEQDRTVTVLKIGHRDEFYDEYHH